MGDIIDSISVSTMLLYSREKIKNIVDHHQNRHRSPSEKRRTLYLTVLANFHFVEPHSCPWSTQQIPLSPHTDWETSAECYDLYLLNCFRLDEERPVVLHRKRKRSMESLCEKRELEGK